MRKKYLSALLFGAILFTPAVTFTSCDDYDDDIANLQEQIDGISADIEDLQAQISAGYWITSVTSIDNGFSVTFSNGSTYSIVNGTDGADGADGAAGTQITIGDDGYWYFDDVKSDYLAVANGESGSINVPYVGEDGYWYFYNEDGEAVKSEYKAVGSAYAVATNGGYYLYLPDENGEMDEGIFLAGAGASITDMELRNLNDNDAAADMLYVYSTSFQFIDLTGGEFSSPSEWGGAKSLPDGQVIYSTSNLGLRINPTDLDATEVEFVLTNSQNKTLSNLKLKASEYTEAVSRSAYGNGLYTLKMDNTTLTSSQASTLEKEITDTYDDHAFAVNADYAIRTDYVVGVEYATAPSLEQIELKGVEESGITVGTTDNKWENIKVGTTYTIIGDDEAALYDLYCTVSQTNADAYGIVIDNENHTFTVNKNPDSSTTAVFFPMTVYTAANNGHIKKTTVTVYLSSEIASTGSYTEITRDLSRYSSFSFDLATMQNGLSDLTSWKLNVDLENIKYELYTDANCTSPVQTSDGNSVVGPGQLFTPTVVNASGSATSDVDAASAITVAIDNSKAADAGMKLETTYYLKVTYLNQSGDTLNSSIIPISFTAPALEDQFSVKSGYVDDEGVIIAYFADTTIDASIGHAPRTVDLDEYFSTNLGNLYTLSGVTYERDDETVIYTKDATGTSYTTADAIANIDATTRKLEFDSTAGKKRNSQFEVGYGVDLIINATTDNYAGWKYADDEDGIYTFEIKMLSTIYEGKVIVDGSTISITANDLVNGAKITGDDIWGEDYNGTTYSLVPDKVGGGWSNPQISDVTLSTDTDEYIQSIDPVAATQSSNGATVEGYFLVKGKSLTTTTDTTLPISVTDVWGYVKSADVPVTIVVN